MELQNFHLIEARYLGPTNNLGSRVKLVSSRFKQTKTIPYNFSFNNARDIAIEWLKESGHNVVGSGEVNGYYVIVCAANDEYEFKPLKETKES
jgi:hypothetical protein